MPHFAHPLALLLLVPLPLLLWRWARRPRAALRFPGLAFVKLPPGRTAWARRGGLGLRVLGLSCLIVALAGPRWPDPESRVPTEGISIALVVDASDSMKQGDFLWHDKVLTRFDAVRKVVRLFVQGGDIDAERLPGRPNDLIALVTFAGRPETDCPLTLDHEAVLGILDEEYPRLLQPTNPGDALAWGLHLLGRAPTKRQVIIYLTDGEDNVSDKALRPREAANLAAALNVPIYAVEIDPVPDEKEPAEGKEARKRLQEVAEISGGSYFTAHNAKGLLDAYAAIDRMERDKIVSFHYRRYEEAFFWFAGAALFFFFLLTALEATIWRTAP